MLLKIKKLSDSAIIPCKAHITDAGYDLFADETILLTEGYVTKVSTGISIELPVGYEAQIRSRSGLSYKYGVAVHNSPGTIDADYRGEIGVLLIKNKGNKSIANTYEINKGDKIAQMVISKLEEVYIKEVDFLDDTIRGNGGFGSTDKK